MSLNAPQLSPVDLIKDSWEPVKNNAGPLIGGMVLTMVISVAAGMIPFGSLVIQGPLMYGMYAVALTASRGKTVDFQELFSGFQRFVPAFVAGLLIGIFTVVGSLLCIIPGIIVGILYMPAYLYMMDENLDFWPAMEKSRTVVWNNFGQWLLLALGLLVLNILGAIPCGLGLFITGPMTFVAVAKAFDLEQGAGQPLLPQDDMAPGAPE